MKYYSGDHRTPHRRPAPTHPEHRAAIGERRDATRRGTRDRGQRTHRPDGYAERGLMIILLLTYILHNIIPITKTNHLS